MDTDQYQTQIDDFVSAVESSNPHEPEFLQAIKEFAESVVPFVEKNEKYKGLKILERLCEPERVVMFRVVWEDDKHVFHVNKGYRIDFNSAIGPYKGGLRFHPSVNLS
ncbi:gdhA, partial [Symbiodinium microadriaticum]